MTVLSWHEAEIGSSIEPLNLIILKTVLSVQSSETRAEREKLASKTSTKGPNIFEASDPASLPQFDLLPMPAAQCPESQIRAHGGRSRLSPKCRMSRPRCRPAPGGWLRRAIANKFLTCQARSSAYSHESSSHLALGDQGVIMSISPSWKAATIGATAGLLA